MTTSLTPAQIQIMKDDIATALVCNLINDYNYSLQDALDILYTSKTFESLQDSQTGLYYQSPGYVYSFIVDEINAER